MHTRGRRRLHIIIILDDVSINLVTVSLRWDFGCLINQCLYAYVIYSTHISWADPLPPNSCQHPFCFRTIASDTSICKFLYSINFCVGDCLWCSLLIYPYVCPAAGRLRQPEGDTETQNPGPGAGNALFQGRLYITELGEKREED